jgi:hypothetical protein
MQVNPLTQNLSAEHLLQHMPVSTFVLNARHQVFIWNKACEQLTGLKAAEMIGTDQHWRGLLYRKTPVSGGFSARQYLSEVSSLYEQASDFPSYSDICHTENWCRTAAGCIFFLSMCRHCGSGCRIFHCWRVFLTKYAKNSASALMTLIQPEWAIYANTRGPATSASCRTSLNGR